MVNPNADQDKTLADAKQAAYHYLAFRPRTESQVRQRLRSRFPIHIVEEAVAQLQSMGYLDDAAFARLWRQQRERRRPKGEILLRQELLRLGVHREVVEGALTGFDAPANAYRAAQPTAARLIGGSFQQFRKKLWGYLRRRGFDSEVTAQTINRLWRELTDTLHGHENTDTDAD